MSTFFKSVALQLSHLAKGSLLLATFPDFRVILERAREAGGTTFGNAVYSVKLSKPTSLEMLRADPFGNTYSFSLGDAVQDCEESIVFLPAVDEVARESGLRLLASQNLGQFVREHCSSGQFDDLLAHMQCLPNRGQRISREEWEVVQFYCVAAFGWI